MNRDFFTKEMKSEHFFKQVILDMDIYICGAYYFDVICTSDVVAKLVSIPILLFNHAGMLIRPLLVNDIYISMLHKVYRYYCISLFLAMVTR